MGLKFTKALNPENHILESRSRYIDPVTKDPITNRSRLVCLRPNGTVMLYDTYKNLVEPDGVYDGNRIQKADVIELQKGGTGYASHDWESVKASKRTVLGLGS